MDYPEANLIEIVVPVRYSEYTLDEPLPIVFHVIGKDLNHPSQFDYRVMIDGVVFATESKAKANERGLVQVFKKITHLKRGHHALQLRATIPGTSTEIAETAIEFTIARENPDSDETIFAARKH